MKDTAEMVIECEKQKEVDEINEFLESLNEIEKKEFKGFLQGVKFVKELAADAMLEKQKSF